MIGSWGKQTSLDVWAQEARLVDNVLVSVGGVKITVTEWMIGISSNLTDLEMKKNVIEGVVVHDERLLRKSKSSSEKHKN